MEKRKKEPRIADIKIEKFSKEGQGQGYIDQPNGEKAIIEVPFSVPGDEARVELLKRRRRVNQSRMLELLTPSPDRIEPRCIHFGACGGCRWQQIPYELQLQQKEMWINNYIKPYLQASSVVHPIIPCTPPWQYRNKVELTFSSDKKENTYLGFILYGTRGHVFNLQECHLVQPWMNQAVHAVRDWWLNSGLDAYHAMRDTGALRTLTLRAGQNTGDRMVILTVSGNADYALKKDQLSNFIACVRKAVEPENPEEKLSIFLRIQQIAKGQRTNFYELHLHGPAYIRETMNLPSPFTFYISPTAFFQPNTGQAEKLYKRAVELAELTANALVYDLYCGTGTLGISLARHVKEVIGIELSPESVLDARENIKINGLTNVTIKQGDVAKILPELLMSEKKKPDVVLVDPPRAGLEPQAIKHLLEINAPQIIYISCNPATQANNLEPLTQAGYQIQAVQPVDQFPQTVHVENIVTLRKT